MSLLSLAPVACECERSRAILKILILGSGCPAGSILGRGGQSLPRFLWRNRPASPTSGSGTGKTKTCCFFLAEIALAELDRINLEKQMVLKFAAIIGPVFTTQQLVHIICSSKRQGINSLLDKLVEDNILKQLDIEKPEGK